jgi:hypothetical protein
MLEARRSVGFLGKLNQEEYRRTEARLDEALAIFAERQEQFSALIDQVRENLAKVRADVAKLRAQAEKRAAAQ